MSDNKVFNPEEKKKLKYLMDEGMSVMAEVETLNGALTDTIKAIAEELEIKPAVLKKAIRTAHKANFGAETDDFELLENILESTGKTL